MKQYGETNRMPTLPGWDVNMAGEFKEKGGNGWAAMKMAPADLMDPGQCTITREEYYRALDDKQLVLLHRERGRGI